MPDPLASVERLLNEHCDMYGYDAREREAVRLLIAVARCGMKEARLPETPFLYTAILELDAFDKSLSGDSR